MAKVKVLELALANYIRVSQLLFLINWDVMKEIGLYESNW
jgi:hypothetical protein